MKRFIKIILIKLYSYDLIGQELMQKTYNYFNLKDV